MTKYCQIVLSGKTNQETKRNFVVIVRSKIPSVYVTIILPFS